MKFIQLMLFVLFFLLSMKLSLASNGCNSGDPECGSIPSNNCDVRQNTTFQQGFYSLPDGIDICANNIVLDCNGALINGAGSSYGIALNPITVPNPIQGITIKNCNVIGHATGIFISSSASNTIINNTVSSNRGAGIFVAYSNRTTIIGNTANSNWNGLGIYRSDLAMVVGNAVNNSNIDGISISQSSLTTLIGNTADSNQIGIRLSNSNFNIIAGNTVNSNRLKGMNVDQSNNSTFTNNTANSNSGDGIALGFLSSGNTLRGNAANSNNLTGISIYSTFNTIIDNTADSNRENGLYFSASAVHSSVNSNRFCFNNQSGPVFYDIYNQGSYNSGANNTCQTTYNWNESVAGGCSFSCQWVTPTNGMVVTQDTMLRPGIYFLPDGISIGANNITLDCNGALINGSTGSTGITLNSIHGSTIKNCNVRGYSFGIYMLSSSFNTLTNNAVISNLEGILIRSSHYNIVTGNTANGNTRGFFGGITLDSSNSNTFVNNAANGNREGISILRSNSNTFVNNTANSNTDIGVLLDLASFNNTLMGNTADFNTHHGISFNRNSDHTAVNSNRFCFNNRAGGSFYDIYSEQRFSNLGANNTCQTTYNWNDIGITGCTFLCVYPSLSLRVIGIPMIGNALTINLTDTIHPNTAYILAMSFASAPGIPLGDGRVIPLYPDPLLFLSVQFPMLIGLSGSVGTLDASGGALARWTIPNVQELAGITVYFAFVTINPALPFPRMITSISNAVPIQVIN